MEKSKSRKFLFLRLPIETQILEDWARASIDIAKTAIIAIPSPFIYYYGISIKYMIYSLMGLSFVIFLMVSLNIIIWQIINNRKEN